jgi:hypothetical protein
MHVRNSCTPHEVEDPDYKRSSRPVEVSSSVEQYPLDARLKQAFRKLKLSTFKRRIAALLGIS